MQLYDDVNDKDQKRKEVKLMFKVAWFAQVLINLDHGILPACTKEFKEDVHLDEVGLGLLGSLVYLGLICGSLTAGPLFQNFSSKKIICFATLMNVVFLSIFPVANNLLWLGISRVGVGFFQVFLVIYFPVWVDLHGEEKKTIWLTFLQVAVPLGVFCGYLLTALFVHLASWRWSFYTQIALLIPCLISFCYVKSKHMATNKEIEERRESIMGQPRDQYLLSISLRMSASDEAFKEYLLGDDNINQGTNLKDEEDNIDTTLSYFSNLKLLWERKVFVYTMLAISSLYFVVTGIQFWISDYLRQVLLIPKQQVFISFSILSITAPTIGVLFGGTVVSRFGGYSSKPALPICCIFGVMASAFGLPIPFLNDFTTLAVLLWFVLFFGGALMPPVMGIMLSSIPKTLRAFGNSSAQIFQNLLGYFPAPFLYGFVCKITGGYKSRWGMIMLMFWSLFGVVGLYGAKLSQDYQRVKRLEKFKKNDNIELETVESDDENKNIEDNELKTDFRPKTNHQYVPPIKKDKNGFKELKHAVIDYNTLPSSGSNFLTQENLANMAILFGGGRPTRVINTTREELLMQYRSNID